MRRTNSYFVRCFLISCLGQANGRYSKREIQQTGDTADTDAETTKCKMQYNDDPRATTKPNVECRMPNATPKSKRGTWNLRQKNRSQEDGFPMGCPSCGWALWPQLQLTAGDGLVLLLS